ncbi:DUF4097 family beta strand repeat-containing protein [Thalassomonas sp. M1454]|uniref:DUF4097 family beta strand repeat-containing protein n=1 Tax=Thalassomonas sp. M1454 TaxID=2594477 RepID=UPI00118099E4|nr:DUF4097 family beta strand repeat-containing protein [Thalassomonas sp. M1454]TRX53424.1 DUF4097 family beta strand repeat protein [Thalassomonas sp. M1454]
MNVLKQITLSVFILACSFSLQAKQVNESLEVKENVRVKIENLRGKVAIIGTDSLAVKVSGVLDYKATDFVFKKEGNSVIIQVQMPQNMNHSFWDNDGQETDLKIHVPQSARLNFKGVSSDASIENVNNEINVRTVSGDIDAKDLSSRIELDTVSGDIKSQRLAGRITLNTVSGDIKDSASQGRINYQAVSGDIEANSTANEVYASVISGNMDITLAQVIDAELTSISGDIDANLELSDQGLLKMSSVSGDIDVFLQKEVNASVRVHSQAGGKIFNKLNNDKVKKAKHGPSSHLDTTVGDGSASIKASTVSGRVGLYY